MAHSADERMLAAAAEQQSRGLTRSATWLAELALAAAPTFLASPAATCSASAAAASSATMTVRERLQSQRAAGLMAQQEYLRCARLLLPDTGTSVAPSALHPKLLFQGCYALFLAGEKAAIAEHHANAKRSSDASGVAAHVSGRIVAPGPAAGAPGGATAVINPHLDELDEVLGAALEAYPQDAYLLWLHGVVLRTQGNQRLAAANFIAAVIAEPLLRCAWEDLLKLTSGTTQLAEVLAALGRPASASPVAQTTTVATTCSSFMCDIFTAQVRSQFLGLGSEVVAEWAALQRAFPESCFIHCQLGAALSSRREFEVCIEHYEIVRGLDRLRLDGMDDYSNALFVRRDKLELGKLAEECYRVDPFRAESNIAAGNYYAIVRRHERSLQHFRRAVTIDPSAVSAWTLMGHEYLEVKNANAAVAAYRNAIAVNPADYRPWYGLGQIYELLQVFHYALHYYWQTTTLRPHDPRMWAAVAGCLERQDRVTEAVACLERAEACDRAGSDLAPQRVRRLVLYYRNARGGEAKAIHYTERLVQCAGLSVGEQVEALQFLVDRYTKRAHKLLAMPSRSPSFEPSAVASMPRPLSSAKREEAAGLLAVAEGYLQALQQLAVDEELSGGTVPALSRTELCGAASIAQLVGRLGSALDVVRHAVGGGHE